MFIAAAEVILDFYGNSDISAKRAHMKDLAKELHRKFNVSALEILEKIDDPERCVLGLSAVGSSYREAREHAEKTLQFLDGVSFARVTSEDIEVFQLE